MSRKTMKGRAPGGLYMPTLPNPQKAERAMLNPLPIVYALEMKKTSRAPYGARGLKYIATAHDSAPFCRAPYGARGLKSGEQAQLHNGLLSRPVWGAWIEIALPPDPLPIPRVAPRMGWLFTGHCLPARPGRSRRSAGPGDGWANTGRNRIG